MTIAEALAARIPRIRKPIWAMPDAYLRLPLLHDGQTGPWAELYDPRGQEICEVPIGSQKVCVAMPNAANDDGYEPYTGEPHPAEQQNYAKTYAEE